MRKLISAFKSLVALARGCIAAFWGLVLLPVCYILGLLCCLGLAPYALLILLVLHHVRIGLVLAWQSLKPNLQPVLRALWSPFLVIFLFGIGMIMMIGETNKTKEKTP
jgi:hypothetical protein